MIESRIQSSIDVKQKILNDKVLLEKIESVADMLVNALKNGHKILFCGNGGSAADAQHLAAELSGRFYFDRDPLPAEALHCNTSYLTAVANDYGYNAVYARMIKGSGFEGDVLIGLSTSGNSTNILNAFEEARNNKMKTVAMTGSTGGKMKDVVDVLLNIPSDDTPRIQESHIMVGHIICEIVEAKIFPGH
ncbi:MAG: D-sedoheptulose 7-phosphate isomerase [Paludibacter sp.]|nr:D-sedoheptulose 7-phosphate isomerase [Paludibacter sp.]